jgi:mevalonate kinase
MARRAIEAGDLQTLGSLMTRDHDLLIEIGVSSEQIDRLVDAALSAGAWGAKLSGAGLGGNMIALVAEETAEDLANALIRVGAAKTFITRIEERTARKDA